MYLYLDEFTCIVVSYAFRNIINAIKKEPRKNDSMRRQLEGKRKVVCWVNATGIGSVLIDLDTKTLI